MTTSFCIPNASQSFIIAPLTFPWIGLMWLSNQKQSNVELNFTFLSILTACPVLFRETPLDPKTQVLNTGQAESRKSFVLLWQKKTEEAGRPDSFNWIQSEHRGSAFREMWSCCTNLCSKIRGLWKSSRPHSFSVMRLLPQTFHHICILTTSHSPAGTTLSTLNYKWALCFCNCKTQHVHI